ncbi:MAG TPA: amidohydrolase family protein [Chloroflexia bacterium]|nr:amidohydrolase family protein [Chloroflexia bacterium]
MSTIRIPGLIDPHVHLRDPGATHKEDFTTGTLAALAGGFTMLVDMPNNYGSPVVSPAALSGKIAATQGRLFCDVGLFYGASPANLDTYSQVAPEVVGLKLYLNHTTGDLKIEGAGTIRSIMLAWPANKPLCVHAEGSALAMVLDLLPSTGRGVHVCHVSLAEEIAMIRQAKERGLPVTCEVAPHHLYLTQDDLPHLRGLGVMKPPLGGGADVDALWRNLHVIDMIATDHAPHTLEEKESDSPPFGVPGLETSLPLMLTAVRQGRLNLDTLVQMMHHAPQRIFHLPDQPDTYIDIDPDLPWRLSSESLYTKCGWTPFDGMPVFGAVRDVWLRGEQVVEEGRVITVAPNGRFTRPVA